MEDHKSIDQNFVDPDPFVIANTFISAAALSIQFIQFWRENSKKIELKSKQFNKRALSHLESELLELLSKGNSLNRITERAVRDPEKEIYDCSYRIGHSMMIDIDHFDEFNSHLSDLILALSQTSRWINYIIIYEPDLSARLGLYLNENIGDMPARINEIMEKGLSNREAIQSAKQTLQSLATAIDQELKRKN